MKIFPSSNRVFILSAPLGHKILNKWLGHLIEEIRYIYSGFCLCLEKKADGQDHISISHENLRYGKVPRHAALNRNVKLSNSFGFKFNFFIVL